jgi:hypothetical protein
MPTSWSGVNDELRLRFPLHQRRIDMDPRTQRIRALNDELRQNFGCGLAVMTPGIAALGQEAVERIVKTIAVFDDFCQANDPHEEHDFGSFEADGHTVYFKIDYLDRDLKYHSPDPTDPAVTMRVITVMLAEEY